jgi:tRNA threonylcarbamoyl adenosine modification protein YeaZ/ribosomal-protein-alanine acetyltransferase
VSGLAIECATGRIDVLVRDAAGGERGRCVEEVEHGHARRLAGLVARALDQAEVAPGELEWIAADLGPGSFTGVRVGLATAHALALAGGARVIGASSLAALALSTPVRRALVVPLVPAGRSESYAGFYRADSRGVRLLTAPRVLQKEGLHQAIEESRGAAGVAAVRLLGPGVPRWREDLERWWPGATTEPRRFDGLSAADLAAAALSGAGPAAGLPATGEEPRPLYVRSAQAEERVRHRVTSADPPRLRSLEPRDVPAVAAIEVRIFSDPWPESFFIGELAHPFVYARVAEHRGGLAGYSVALIGAGIGHLGNLAVVPEARRRGVATALLEDVLGRATQLNVGHVGLEVRVSNFAAQALYRAHGFRVSGLRKGYYRDTGEDALMMEWRPA